jgi:hypothetical protein
MQRNVVVLELLRHVLRTRKTISFFILVFLPEVLRSLLSGFLNFALCGSGGLGDSFFSLMRTLLESLRRNTRFIFPLHLQAP